MKRPVDLRTLIVLAVARRLWMARESKKCPPGTLPLNPPGWLPADQIPPGNEVPDNDLPPSEEEPPPEPEFPPHEGDQLSDGSAERSSEADELIETVVLGGVSFVDTVEEEDSLLEDVVEAPPTVPAIITEGLLGIGRESDTVLEDVVFAPVPHIPEILERGFIGTTIESDSVVEQVIVFVPGPPDPDLPPPPQPEFWNRTLQNQTYQGDLVVPAGERWLIGPGVRLQGNLRTVAGTIGMRPGSSLEFVGAVPENYVGGGMTYAPEFANDFGIWIGTDGTLDIQGTPKISWNRTGVDPTWAAGDELWIAPTAFNDFSPRRWFPGDPIPLVHATLEPAEICNVTRDITIKGPGHIHIHSHHPQRIEYCRLQDMGVSAPAFQGPVLGRYALHFHHGYEGTAGTVVRGVASVNAQGKVFVPHLSHGISFVDCCAVESAAEGLWWDAAHETNNILVDRMCLMGIEMPFALAGASLPFVGYELGAGTNMEIRNSVATGIRGGDHGIGFNWPEPTPIFDPVLDKLVWTFDTGNVSHNNTGPGLRFWNNSAHDHIVENYKSYRNKSSGIENGAYVNLNEYRNCVLYQDGWGNWFDDFTYPAVIWNSNGATSPGARRASIRNSSIIAREGAALISGHRQLPSFTYMEIFDTQLTAAAGHPKVIVQDGTHPWRVHFKNTNVTPTDIEFENLAGSGTEDTHIILENTGGLNWNINVTGGVKVVTPF